MLVGQEVAMYNDNSEKETYMEQIEVPESGEISITIQPNGGFVLTE